MKLRILLAVLCLFVPPILAYLAGFGVPSIRVADAGDPRSSAVFFFQLAFLVWLLFELPYYVVIPHAILEGALAYATINYVQETVGTSGLHRLSDLVVIIAATGLLFLFLSLPAPLIPKPVVVATQQ